MLRPSEKTLPEGMTHIHIISTKDPYEFRQEIYNIILGAGGTNILGRDLVKIPTGESHFHQFEAFVSFSGIKDLSPLCEAILRYVTREPSIRSYHIYKKTHIDSSIARAVKKKGKQGG